MGISPIIKYADFKSRARFFIVRKIYPALKTQNRSEVFSVTRSKTILSYINSYNGYQNKQKWLDSRFKFKAE